MKRTLTGAMMFVCSQGALAYADSDSGTLRGAMEFPRNAIMLCIVKGAFKGRHLVLCCGRVAWVDATRCGVL